MKYEDMETEALKKELDDAMKQRREGKMAPYLYRLIAGEIIRILARRDREESKDKVERAWNDAMSIL